MKLNFKKFFLGVVIITGVVFLLVVKTIRLHLRYSIQEHLSIT